jgi:predicted nucleic acid-binding protein
VIAYVDTSVILGHLLRQPRHFPDFMAWRKMVISELAELEVRRTLDRQRTLGWMPGEEMGRYLELALQILIRCECVALDKRVLRRAMSTYGAPLGTLDSIHLATALMWLEENGGELQFLTHDRQLAVAARTCLLTVKTSPDEL